MPTPRDTLLDWARLALAALLDPTPAGLARAALAEAVRRQEARRETVRSEDLDRVALRVSRELRGVLEPFLEHEAAGGAGPAVHATVERLLTRCAPGAGEINRLLRDPEAIARRILHDGARELTGLGPVTEVPLVEAVLVTTYRVLLRQPPVLDALRADYERGQLRRGRSTADKLEMVLERQNGLVELVKSLRRRP